MNRLVSTLLLAAFAAQHFMCCCSGLGAHACDQDHSAAVSVCQIGTGGAEVISGSECHDDQCCCSHGEPCDGVHLHDGDCPCDGSHGHHLCVGSHIFFMPTPRAELPPSIDWHDFGFWPAESSLLITLASLAVESHEGVDCGPPLTAQARRSALCVYRI